MLNSFIKNLSVIDKSKGSIHVSLGLHLL